MSGALFFVKGKVCDFCDGHFFLPRAKICDFRHVNDKNCHGHFLCSKLSGTFFCVSGTFLKKCHGHTKKCHGNKKRLQDRGTLIVIDECSKLGLILRISQLWFIELDRKNQRSSEPKFGLVLRI